ncbi:MAG: 16S rRNA (guanine(966)-N(2))-methyltransferase RsmD [Crocinitomicaceae bacterium]
MRIVSGKYRGKRVFPPKKFPSRPTTDYAKEALFNILENKIDWEECNVLDLFAGTGNISAEFLSRGAKKVLSIDKNPICIKHLHSVKKELNDENWFIQRNEVNHFVLKCEEQFEVIFADPPFGIKGLAELIDRIFEEGVLTADGMLILEHGKENSFEDHPKFSSERDYGGVQFSFFE